MWIVTQFESNWWQIWQIVANSLSCAICNNLFCWPLKVESTHVCICIYLISEFINLEILRVPHGHDYANMIWEFDNEALESYWMLYISRSLPLPTRLPLFVERPHTQYSYLLCVIGLLIFELLRLSLWACRFVVVVRVCLTCPLCVHIVFIVIHAGLLLSLVASIFNTPQHWISPPSDAQFP